MPPRSAPTRPATNPTVPRSQPISARTQAGVDQERPQHPGRECFTRLVGDDEEQQTDHAGTTQEVARGRSFAHGFGRRRRLARPRDGNARDCDEHRHGEERQRPAELSMQNQQQSSADDHSNPVAGNLETVGHASFAVRQHVDGEAVGRDVLGRGERAEQENAREQDRRRRRRRENRQSC